MRGREREKKENDDRFFVDEFFVGPNLTTTRIIHTEYVD